MKKLTVTRNVQSPLFPGILVDRITFPHGTEFCVDPDKTNKLLTEYRYAFVKKTSDGDEIWEKI